MDRLTQKITRVGSNPLKKFDLQGVERLMESFHLFFDLTY